MNGQNKFHKWREIIKVREIKIMLTVIHPKLPMRNKQRTLEYYVNQLGFQEMGGSGNFPEYLMITRDAIEIHFFLFTDLNPQENYGQIYIRTDNIDGLYKELLDRGTAIHPNGPLTLKPWGQKEFSLLDPDTNLITFGQKL